MHPAYSIIFFTTATGAGYGMLILLAGGAMLGMAPFGTAYAVTALGLAFALVAGGLISSTFHLGHPERSLRALTQWRSSWLSREGVAALVTFPVAFGFALEWLRVGGGSGASKLIPVLGLTTVFLCVTTIICTGMIYASLKPIRRWCNGWVVPNYLTLGLMTGALWVNAIAVAFGLAGAGITVAALGLVAAACVFKLWYWWFIDHEAVGPTAASATGLGDLGTVRLLDAPHTADNYLLKEMGYRVARKHAHKLRRVVLWSGFGAPFVLVGLGLLTAPGILAVICAAAAALSGSAGVLVERWLFFAEAKHSVTLYYGAARA